MVQGLFVPHRYFGNNIGFKKVWEGDGVSRREHGGGQAAYTGQAVTPQQPRYHVLLVGEQCTLCSRSGFKKLITLSIWRLFVLLKKSLSSFLSKGPSSALRDRDVFGAPIPLAGSWSIVICI